MFDKFKKAFKVKRTNDFNRRKGKVEAALAEILQAIDPLEALLDNGNESARLPLNAARSSHRALVDRLAQAEALVAGKPDEAYKLLKDIKKQAKLAAKAALKAREEKVFQDPGSRVELDMGDDWQGPAPKIHPAAIKGFETLSKAEIAQATKDIGDKIRNGKQLLDGLLTRPEDFLDKEPEIKEITDLMWYLRNKAEEMVGEPFEKGALSLPDNGNLLRGYLDRCQEVYNRYSSHIKAQQEKVGGSARAVDAYEGDIRTNPDSLLPYGMNTMLVQSMQIEGTGEQRLYVKLETESARLGAKSLTAMASAYAKYGLDVDPQFAESRGDVDFATLPQSRPQHEHDMERTKEHGKNLIIKQKSRIKGLKRFTENEIGGNKDTVGKELVPRYEAIVKVAKKLELDVDLLKAGNYKKEVNEMIANLEAFTATLEAAELDNDGAAKLTRAFDEFTDYCIAKGLDQNAQSRVMTEVVLTSDFLAPDGVTGETVLRELTAKLEELGRRNPDELNPGTLQALANAARRSLQKAANFMASPGVKDAAAALQAEIDRVSNELELLRHIAPAAASRLLRERLTEMAELRRRSLLVDADDFPTPQEAQSAYDRALQIAHAISKFEHLGMQGEVQRLLNQVIAEADEFIDVIEAAEAALA